MTREQRFLTAWATGGLFAGAALVLANLFIRYREALAPRPDYVSTDCLERNLRRHSMTQGCAVEE